MKMTRKKFFDMAGEYPEDVIGEDWENEIEEWLEDSENVCPECGGFIGLGGKDNDACNYCKMD